MAIAWIHVENLVYLLNREKNRWAQREKRRNEQKTSLVAMKRNRREHLIRNTFCHLSFAPVVLLYSLNQFTRFWCASVLKSGNGILRARSTAVLASASSNKKSNSRTTAHLASRTICAVRINDWHTGDNRMVKECVSWRDWKRQNMRLN